MKKKSSFDIKEFFLQHIEKIVAAAALLLAGVFALGGASMEPLSWQPDALKQSADSAAKKIEANEIKPIDLELKIRDYGEFAKGIKVGVKPELYRTDKMWEESLFPVRTRRGEVQLLPVNKLTAASGIGAILTKAKTSLAQQPAYTTSSQEMGGAAMAAGAELTGKRWVTLTGLIPIYDQLEEYLQAYANAIYTEPSRDFPRYAYYRIERRESENAPWVDIKAVDSFMQERDKWAGVGVEQVDPAYLAPSMIVPMAYPLAPLAKGLYGESIALPPDVPMLSDVLLSGMTDKEKLERELAKIPVADEKTLFELDPFATGLSRSGADSVGGGFSGNNTTLPRILTNAVLDKLDAMAEPVVVSNYLFRFFDYNVEPGKSYQYRVKLLLVNPNYKLEDKHVLNREITQKPYLETPISESSNWITVPTDARVLMTGVSQGRDVGVSLMSVYFDMKDSTEWVYEASRVAKGSMANFERRSGRAAAPAAPALSDMMSGEEMGMTIRPTKKPAAETRQAEFNSNVCVMDIFGGYRLSGGQNSPGRILVMEPSGVMTIREVNKEADEVSKYKEPAKSTLMPTSV